MEINRENERGYFVARQRVRKRKRPPNRVARKRGVSRRGKSLGRVLAVAATIVVGVVGIVFVVLRSHRASPADPEDEVQVIRGAALYQAECSRCHGAELEGQPDWESPLADGSYPAPPHDASGHTWHHADSHLFRVVKHGGEAEDSTMPGFADKLSDSDIWATLAFIKSRWPEAIRRRQPRSPR